MNDGEYLERINTLMWETCMVKDHPFGKEEGMRIMDILEEWAIEDEARKRLTGGPQ